MKKFIFIFCLLFAIPAHSFQTIRAQNTSYSSTIQQINYTVTCKRPSRSLFNSKKRHVRLFANKYKKKTLDKYLHRVILCKDMRVNNAKWVRGTYDMESLTLFIEISKDYEDTEYALHHEFSSILLIKNKFYKIKQKWIKNNKQAYRPGWGANSNSKWNSENKKLRLKGFLFPYCTTNFENDFNVVASYYKSTYIRYDLMRASRKYPLIKKKLQIVKKFYEEL
jgi:hypothetical protein